MDDEDYDDFEDGPTYRSQEEIYNIPKMVKLSSGEVVVGLIVNETYMFMELKWPVLVTQSPVKMSGKIFPMLMMFRYGLGVYEEFITLNKASCVWWNDTESDIDKFYYNQLPKLYPSSEKYLKANMTNSEDQEYPSENDGEVESMVTKLTVGRKINSISEMIDLMTGVSKTPPSETGSK